MIKRIALTSGDPAGIGPNLCLSLLNSLESFKVEDYQLVILADRNVLDSRHTLLGLPGTFKLPEFNPTLNSPGIYIKHIRCPVDITPGEPDPSFGQYVVALLDEGISGCQSGLYQAMVTAPVNKAVINQSGTPFTGHTEYLQQAAGVKKVVMMLANAKMKVSLASTHIPLKEVAESITKESLEQVLEILNQDLIAKFGLVQPEILVAGLNPHAGEAGLLGQEEIEVIEPVLAKLREKGLNLIGPLPADTLFTPKHLDTADAVLAMYHDQGLPVLKYQGFGESANITLGLPFIRTSVDHGTAYDLAKTKNANNGSLLTAIDYALTMAQAKSSN